MRIGILCHSGLGGSSRVASEMALGLAERRHEVHLFARSVPFNLQPNPPWLHLHSLIGGSPISGELDANWSERELDALLSMMTRVTMAERLDVLHYHYAMPFALSAASLRLMMGPSSPVIVGTLHGTDVSHFGRDVRIGPVLAASLRVADEITTVSQSHSLLSSDLFQLPDPIRVIPNFVNLRRFRPLPRGSEIGSGRPYWRIAHVSNFRPVKDPVSVARIFLRILRHLPAQLWLIGVGGELAAMRDVLREGGAEDHVRFWGYQDDVSPFLASADLLLMASRSESFCLAALEAMACGVPVLAGAVGGLAETVQHGRSGLLFPLEDHERAEQLAINLLSNNQQYAEMRRQASLRAQQFGRERILSIYESLYRQAISRRRMRIRPDLDRAGLDGCPGEIARPSSVPEEFRP